MEPLEVLAASAQMPPLRVLLSRVLFSIRIFASVSALVAWPVQGLRLDTVPYVWPSYWQQFASAAGVYIVGEAFDGRFDFVANYTQANGGPLPGMLNYPMFFALRNVFADGQSMTQLQSAFQSLTTNFKDISVLGSFIDNHDNPRFLNVRNDQAAYMNALAYVLLAEGIPIIYYGTEAAFNGGNDPYCREPLWPTGFTANSSALGTFISALNRYRQSVQLWDAGEQVQRYADNTFYAFSRGDTFVALTNVGAGGAQQTRSITYHPYTNGQQLCNVLSTSDCVTVANGAFSVTLSSGMPKVYEPSA